MDHAFWKESIEDREEQNYWNQMLLSKDSSG